jgi:phosphoribosyl-ATP pyrophosphohydrolase/phosphoribosyl-AMP cyclohydrolase
VIIARTEQLDDLAFAKSGGMLPVVAQHALTGEVLMLAFATREALARTLESGEMWYWSRSRAELWRKGATSGNTQLLVSLHGDCDSDSVLARVQPNGPSCHTNAFSCFDAPPVLAALGHVLAARATERPEGSYTARLLADRNLRLKKLGEEATELAVACADEDAARAAEEAADLIYHVLVACAAAGVDANGVLKALEGRLPNKPTAG